MPAISMTKGSLEEIDEYNEISYRHLSHVIYIKEIQWPEHELESEYIIEADGLGGYVSVCCGVGPGRV